MEIERSKFTRNVKASEVKFNLEDKVKYRLLNGKVVEVIIKSEKMRHPECPTLGYEALFVKDNEMNFISEARIISWEGQNEYAV